MTIVIDGTTGISGVDGTASNPSYEGTDSNTGIFFPAADTIAFAEGGAEVARFDSAGKFLVGTTTSPNQQAVIYRTSSNTGNGALLLDGNGSYAGLQFALSGTLRGSISSDTPDFYITHAGNINFRTGSGDHVGGTTRATITGGGIFELQSPTANGAYVRSGANFTLASNATINITSSIAGAALVLIYNVNDGAGAVFFANYLANSVKIAGDGAATDTGTTFAVYKNASNHVTTIRNRYATSQTFRIAVYSAEARP